MTTTPSAQPHHPRQLVPGARRVYLAFAGLFAVGVVLQVFFAGLGVLVDSSYFGLHTTFAHLLELFLLATLVLGVVGRVGWRMLGLSVLLLMLFGMQYAFMYGFQGPMRALHVVNALALFWLALQLIQGSWRLIRAAPATLADGAYGPGNNKAAVGRSVAGGIAILVGAVILFGVIFGNGPGFIGSGSAPPQGESPDASMTGAQLYAQHCAGCHGEDGGGGFGPTLAGNNGLEDAPFVIGQVLNGGGGMPAFGNRLSDEEVAALASHVRSSWGNAFGLVSADDVAGQR